MYTHVILAAHKMVNEYPWYKVGVLNTLVNIPVQINNFFHCRCKIVLTLYTLFLSKAFWFLYTQSRGMKKQTIDEFVSSNRFLLVPRLVNQKLFDELCPVKQFHRRRK